ncbi:Uncharacterised protein [uncultured archaeon]|nr:Uncharacterised protein [uncultured archaeon]
MSEFSGSERAASSVLGVAMLIGLTVIMVSIVALSVSSVYGLVSPGIAPQAKIVAIEAKGGLPPSVAFEDNTIKLKHKGGDSLDMGRTKIIIYGKGRSYRPVFRGGYVPSYPNIGNLQVLYLNLTKHGKTADYDATNKNLLKDGSWSTGEILSLSGEDSLNSDDIRSSVLVFVDGDGETSNNYGFKAGENVYITLVDTLTNQIISSTSAVTAQE